MRITRGVRGLSIIDVAAIVEAAAVAEPMSRDDFAGVVHEVGGFAPPALIEVAGGAVVVAGVRNMAAMRGAADRTRFVASGDEVGDQRLEPARKVARNPDWSGCGGNCYRSPTTAVMGCMGHTAMVNVSVGLPMGVPMMPVMVIGGLGLGGAQGKDCCRYQQSHTQYLFVCCSLDALPECCS
jgi:hypothetical protein